MQRSCPRACCKAASLRQAATKGSKDAGNSAVADDHALESSEQGMHNAAAKALEEAELTAEGANSG